MSIHDPHEFIKYKLSADTHVRDGRNLYEHLCNVEKILKICGCDDSVCLAGLFHSVYGTSKWRHESIRDRELVRSIIGERAEHLVWIFSNAKRPFVDYWFCRDRRKNCILVDRDPQLILSNKVCLILQFLYGCLVSRNFKNI